MKVVFIAGPISNKGTMTAPEQASAVTLAGIAGLHLLAAGFAPIIPQLSWYIDPMSKYPQWYEADYEFLRRSDLLLRLPGKSWGADKEVALASQLGLSVYYSVEAVIQHESQPIISKTVRETDPVGFFRGGLS